MGNPYIWTFIEETTTSSVPLTKPLFFHGPNDLYGCEKWGPFARDQSGLQMDSHGAGSMLVWPYESLRQMPRHNDAGTCGGPRYGLGDRRLRVFELRSSESCRIGTPTSDSPSLIPAFVSVWRGERPSTESPAVRRACGLPGSPTFLHIQTTPGLQRSPDPLRSTSNTLSVDHQRGWCPSC